MQLSTLVALLPFLMFASAAPAPQFGADKAPGNGDYKPPPIPEADKDGTFTINILGAELYEADLGDKVLGSFTGRAPIPAIAPVVQRLKPKGGGVLPLPEQIYGGMFALKTDLTTAVVQCAVTSINTIAPGAVVTWDIRDAANPKADVTKDHPEFKDAYCKPVKVVQGTFAP